MSSPQRRAIAALRLRLNRVPPGSLSITVIIPAYNEEQYVADCIESVLRHKPENLREIIVVDNASTDATAQVAARYPHTRVVHEPKKGLTRARQRGLMEATGDLIAFVDADTRVTPRWFSQVNAAYTDPQLVCYSGPYDYYDLPDWQRTFVTAYWLFVAVPTYAVTRYMAVGGNFVARRDALHAIGGFDVGIHFYGEDTNIARRLYEQGTVKFDPLFVARSSGRRLQAQGFLTTGVTYVANYLSESILHRPITKSSRDVR